MLKKYSLKEKESLLKKENVLMKNAFDLTLSSTYKIFIAIIDNNGEYSFFTRNETPNEFIENNLMNVKESKIKKVYTLTEKLLKTYTNVKPITQKEQNKEKVTKTKELENSLCQKSVKKSSIYNTNLDLSPPAVCSADELEIIISDKENNLIYDENKNKSNNKYCNKKRTRISNDSNINNEFQQPQPYIPLSQLPISQTIYLENNSISNPKTEQSNKSLYNSNYSNNYLSYFQSYTDEDYSSSNSLYYDSNKNSELSHIQSRKSNQIIPYGAKIRRSFHSNNKNEY